MIKSSIRTTVAAAALSALAFGTAAKDLKTEITVDRTVQPVEREARRPGSLMPVVRATPVEMHRLSLADYTEAAEITRSASVLDPAAYGDRLLQSPYRGYVSAGYFPTFNVGVSAGYKIVDTDRTRLGARLQYNGYSYKPGGESAGGGQYSDNTVSAGLSIDQRVGSNSSLGVYANYTFAAIGLPDGFLNNKQNANMVDAGVSWWSRAGVAGYHIKASFGHFGYGKDVTLSKLKPALKSASENRFTLSGGVGFFGSSTAPRGGIEISGDFISRDNGVEQVGVAIGPDSFVPRFAPISDGTLGVISLTPYYAFNSGRLHGRVGAKVDLSVGGSGKKFHIAPAVMLDWNVVSQLAIYARIGGGERLNSLRSLHEYCPFTGGLWQYQLSHIPVTADLGFNIGPFKGFSARIFGGYAVANDWLMPQYASIVSKDEGQRFDGCNYGSYDLKGWHAGVGLAYDWRSKVKAEVTAETATNGRDDSYYLWLDRAKYSVRARIEARPVEALRIEAGYELRTDRHNYFYDGVFGYALDLRSVSDLSFGASYDINDAFTVFARGENLLNRRYDMVEGIRAQGVKGLAGVSYKF